MLRVPFRDIYDIKKSDIEPIFLQFGALDLALGSCAKYSPKIFLSNFEQRIIAEQKWQMFLPKFDSIINNCLC